MLQHSTTLSKQISIAYETQGGQDASETSFSFPRKKKKGRKCVGLESSGSSLTFFTIVPKVNADQYAATDTTTGTTLVKGYPFFFAFLSSFEQGGGG